MSTKLGWLLPALSTLLLMPTPAIAGPKQPAVPARVEDEVIVKYRNSTSHAQRTNLVARHGGWKLKELDQLGTVHVKLPPGKSVEQALEEFQADYDVEYVQPNYIYTGTALPTTVPNDTSFPQQWALFNNGQTIAASGVGGVPNITGPTALWATHNPPPAPGASGYYDLGAEYAWDSVTDCSQVLIAVLDSGINPNAGSISTNLLGGDPFGADFTTGVQNVVPGATKDYFGHGTHVAGIIGAPGNDATGITGLCWTAKMISVRVLDKYNSGTTANLALGINYAVASAQSNGFSKMVMNMSLGSQGWDSTVASAIAAAGASGYIVVAAAGNSGLNVESTPFYPCAYANPNVICVAAVDQAGTLASFSNYGSYSVDIAAPGTNIRSLWAGAQYEDTDMTVADWNTGMANGHWGNATLFGYTGLSNPLGADFATKQYVDNQNDDIYKVYAANLVGADIVTLKFGAVYATQLNNDFLSVRYDNGGGGIDPFPGGTLLSTYSGSGSSAPTFDLTPCNVANCSIGFNLTTNGDGTEGSGGFIYGYDLTSLKLTPAAAPEDDGIEAGTSMAAPFVTAIAALVWTQNPNYAVSDVVNAVVNGGTSLSALNGLVRTGKAASAIGSVSYLQQIDYTKITGVAH